MSTSHHLQASQGQPPAQAAHATPLSNPSHEESTAQAAPALLVVASDPWTRQSLVEALTRRYGADYRVLAAATPAAARSTLEQLHQAGAEVALVLADLWLPGATGVELLGRARAWHPGATRVLLTTIGDTTAAEPLHRALALGQADLFMEKPWRSPEEWVYPQVSEALAAWWHANRPRYERVRVVGEQWAARSHELRDLGTRNSVPFGFYPADTDAGRQVLAELGVDDTRLPVLALADGRVLVDPANAEIADALGLSTHPPAGPVDVTIVGAGPAGLAAAVYAASEGLRTVVVEPEAPGGQAGTSSMIRNYLGFPHGISGEELTRRAYEQARTFGAHVVHTPAATGLRAEGRDRVVSLSDGSEITSSTVVLATGVTYRRLGIPALERLVGAGVFYGAATTEAQAMRGEEVFVVGAGNSAGQAALHLAEYAAKVTILVRGDSLARSLSAYLTDQLMATPNVEIRLGTRLVDGQGQHRLEGLVLADAATGAPETVAAAALFVLIGAEPHTEWLDGVVVRDAGGYILTCRDLAPRYESFRVGWPLPNREPLPLETSLPGVFAIGDVRHNSVKRVASAVGAGAMAIVSVHAYLADLAPDPSPGNQRGVELVGTTAGAGLEQPKA